LTNRVTIDPSICNGKPVITGTRVLVSNVLADLANNEKFDSIIQNYPNIKYEDISACLMFSSELTQFETIQFHQAAV